MVIVWPLCCIFTQLAAQYCCRIGIVYRVRIPLLFAFLNTFFVVFLNLYSLMIAPVSLFFYVFRAYIPCSIKPKYTFFFTLLVFIFFRSLSPTGHKVLHDQRERKPVSLARMRIQVGVLQASPFTSGLR